MTYLIDTPSGFDKPRHAEVKPHPGRQIYDLPARPELRLPVTEIEARLAEALPARPELPETSAMRAQLQVMIALMWEMLGMRGAASAAEHAASQLRGIYNKEKQAVIFRLKQALRRAPEPLAGQIAKVI